MDREVDEEHSIPFARRLLKGKKAVERDPTIRVDGSRLSGLWMTESYNLSADPVWSIWTSNV
jgi:hypothetical protein